MCGARSKEPIFGSRKHAAAGRGLKLIEKVSSICANRCRMSIVMHALVNDVADVNCWRWHSRSRIQSRTWQRETASVCSKSVSVANGSSRVFISSNLVHSAAVKESILISVKLTANCGCAPFIARTPCRLCQEKASGLVDFQLQNTDRFSGPSSAICTFWGPQ